MTIPPEKAIRVAVSASTQSPCRKSKRGAVIFGANDYFVDIYGTGYNGPPGWGGCDGSAYCRRDCGQICVHAEMRALRCVPTSKQCTLYLLHAKTVGGALVAGGPPSCWQCSREILDHGRDIGIAGVWLYQDFEPPRWVLYTLERFHEETMFHHQLHRVRR